ncbi:MAG: Rab family GTPase [Promethearchaeota archaeon]
MTKLVKMKISIIGDFATGKTSLIRRYIDNAFARDYRPTIGSNVFIKKIEITHNDEQYLVSVNLYEVAGQDRWQTVRKTYYSGSQGLIFVGDLSRKRTFHQIRDFWHEDSKDHISENIPKIILANKCDLQEDIEDSEMREISNAIHAFSIIKTSAKENIGVNKAFIELLTEIMNHSDEKLKESESS